MDVTPPVSMDLSDYLGLVRRHWWVVLLLTAVGVGAAGAVTRTLPKEYLSATSVLVQPSGDDTNASGGRTKGEINLDTEAQLVRSTQVAASAAELLRTQESPRDLAKNVTVEVPPNTTVLSIKYAAATPLAAQAGSHAFAEAYLRSREANARFDLTSQAKALDTKVKQLNGQLNQIVAKLGKLGPDSATRPSLDSQRATLQTQINQLNSKTNQIATATVSVGRIISDAGLPNRPRKPDLMVNLAGGAMLGGLIGVLVAAVRQRLDKRVRRGSDVSRRADVPVLAEVTARTKPRLDDVFPPYGTGGRIFNRLRNEVVAALAETGRQDVASTIVVTGASGGPCATLVAANLAAALARTGSEVVLVGAHQPELLVGIAPLAGMLGVQPTPGLPDVVGGRTALSAALQRAPRTPHLHVLATGASASAAGVLQSQALRDVLGQLRQRCDFLVIEAPSAATSADAQSLAGAADAAIVAVELRRTRHPQVADAAEQLRRVGTPLLGAVVVPRLQVPDGTAAAPAPVETSAPDTVLMQRLTDEKLAELDDAAKSAAGEPTAEALGK
ncbi:Wzz/FepE/Etk N-terminal domain-containing protein [Hamadaea tsunoensis]|uniref:Wzz/FepE/Etk N-terminal domain-containing protein n=1 Tax=Hamadaea tsunoensis TaxID=53368 RepID=UPI0007E8BAEE|nr:Wzz/FepE/Etk N-terminal domain-containing protein [Hamadaea tsunoensis]